jgi:hypothetical protein
MKAMPQLKQLDAGYSLWWPGFEPVSSYVGFVMDKVALGQVFSEYFGFPCQSSFHQFLRNHHHLSSGASSGRSTKRLSLTPLRIKKNTAYYKMFHRKHSLFKHCFEYILQVQFQEHCQTGGGG